MKNILLGLFGILLLVQTSFANEWINDVEIVKVGTYQHSTLHFVWLSTGNLSECQTANPSNPVLSFDEAQLGGKSLMSVIISALMAKRKVDVQVNGCDIVEIYLR